MKRDDILSIENQLDFLEKESKNLEETFNKKDLEKFNNSKESMLRSQHKIKRLVLK